MMLMLMAIAAQAMTMDAAQPACTAPGVLPADLSGWNAAKSVRAGADGARAAVVPIGARVDATLLPTPMVRYALRPEKPGGSVSNGGMFAFTVATAGRYRVALGSGAWIDMVRDGHALVSTGHGHGPACSAIKKMVEFDLIPGRYLLQVAANGAPTLSLMVAPAS